MKQNLQCLLLVAASLISSSYFATAQNIAAGGSHSVFVCTNGEVKATGINTLGQLGNGTTNNTIFPLSVTGLTGITAAASRDQFTLFLKSDSTVWAVGYNGLGQFGNGTTTSSDTAVQIPNLTGVVKIAAGFFHSLFLKSDSTVWSCGRNFSGELGDGTQIQRNVPVLVPSMTGIIDIAAGDYHSMFLKSDGTVWSCGDNQNGVLGLGTSSPIQVLNPSQVLSISDVTRIAGGFRHSLFVKQDSTVWACGINNEGQLGDSTNIQKDTVNQVKNLTGVVDVSAGQYHSLFLKGDGTAWGVGFNAYGQLGNGSNISQNIAVQVSGITGVTKISAAGYYHSLFLKSDNTFWACGQNNVGQLGDGTVITTTIPVQVLDSCSINLNVSELSNGVQTNIYPNPSSGIFTMQVLGSSAPIQAIEIYNHVGELVYTVEPNSPNITIDFSQKSKGLYFCIIKNSNRVISTRKIVVN